MVRKGGKLQKEAPLFAIRGWTVPSRDHDRAQSSVISINKHGVWLRRLIFADDFDAVMAILKEDESVEDQFLEVEQKVSIEIYYSAIV